MNSDEEYKKKRLEENKTLEAERVKYSGALYEDVRAAVHEIVRTMRYPNCGKNSTLKMVDKMMTMPHVVRLYDPFFKASPNWYDSHSCTCTSDCCENHDE